MNWMASQGKKSWPITKPIISILRINFRNTKLVTNSLISRAEACCCYLFITEERHDGGAGVVGVLPGNEGGHHEPQQGGEDGHHRQGRDGGEEDGEFVVSHGKNGGNEERLVSQLRDLGVRLVGAADKC